MAELSAILDADGTLLDSMPLLDSAGCRWLRSVGVHCSDALAQELAEMSLEEASAYLQEKLQSFVGKYPCVKGVRGLGLMIGLLLDRPAGSVLASLRAKGMIALSAGETVLRLVPPLTVTQEDCEKAIELIDQALAEVTAG